MDLLPGCFVSLRFLPSLSRNLYQLSLYSPLHHLPPLSSIFLHPLPPSSSYLRFPVLPFFSPLPVRICCVDVAPANVAKQDDQAFLPPSAHLVVHGIVQVTALSCVSGYILRTPQSTFSSPWIVCI